MSLFNNRKNVYLIDLGTGTDRNLLPLSSGLIVSYARSLPALNHAYDFHLLFLREPPEEMARGLQRPFVVGLACYVWNPKATLAVARAIKALHPSALIVLGGYSVPKNSDKCQIFFVDHPYIDILVHGEGEYTFAELLGQLLLDDVDFTQIDGISFRSISTNRLVTTKQRARIENLDTIPSPFLNGVFDDLMMRYKQHITGAIWETNRGCPFSCTFCDWGNADVSKIYKWDIQRLRAEIDWMSRNEIYYIYGADANFGIFYERDLEIAGHVADCCEATGYPRYLMINWTKNSHDRIVSIAERLTKGGVLTSVTLAMQSYNQGTLEAIKRRNIKQDSIVSLKKAFHDRNLPTYTELILGLPMEDYSTFRHGIDESMTRRLDDHFVIYLCTLLKNTEMDSEEYRAKYALESRFCDVGMSRRQFDQSSESEVEEFVVGTSTMPILEWQKSYLFAYMATALFNHRIAFFIMHYIQNELGTSHADFVEFCIDEISQNEDSFPGIGRAVRHIRRQSDLILQGENSMSGPEGLELYSLTPHEAGLALMIHDPESLYLELGKLTTRFFYRFATEVSEELLSSILRYSRLRMPSWKENLSNKYSFPNNVPTYFDALVGGRELPVFTNTPTSLIIQQKVSPGDYSDFAVRLVRGGHTLIVNEARLENEPKLTIPINISIETLQ